MSHPDDAPPEPVDPRRDHVWHTAAPRPRRTPGTSGAGTRLLGLAFVVLATVVVVVALVLVATGAVTTDAPTPRP